MTTMKSLYLIAFAGGLSLMTACEPVKQKTQTPLPPKAEQTTKETPPTPEPREPVAEPVATPTSSMVMIHTTGQGYQYRQPWNKKNPSYAAGFGIYIGDGLFLTNASIVENATFLELLTSDNSKTVIGKLQVVDCEANLALVKVEGPAANDFLEGLVPMELADVPSLGDDVQIWQFNDEGLPIISSGAIESTQLNVPLTANVAFVLYQVKSAVNVVTGGATMPLVIDGKLAGVSLSYETSSQSVLALTAPVIKNFLDQALSGEEYQGTPIFGIQPAELMDPVFRKYLKLPEKGGGLYVLKVSPFSSAEQAGIQKGDVIESINGKPIDGRGIVQDEKLGPVSCAVYMHDLTKIGDVLEVGIRRNGEQQTVQVTMNRDAVAKAFIPEHYEIGQPRYLVYGGLVFQPLTSSYLSEVYEGNPNKMPVNILEVLDKEDDYRKEGRNELVLLTSILPTPATHGYNNYGHALVTKVDGQVLKDMNHLAEILDAASEQDVLKIETNRPPFVIYFSRKDAAEANKYIQQVAFPKLRNLGS